MGLTLLEAAKAADAATQAVIAELVEGEIMRTVPFQAISGSGVFYNREGELPAVGFRGFNESNQDGYGVLNPQSEALRIFGGDLDVDVAMVDMYGPGHRATQIQMKIRALRMTWEIASSMVTLASTHARWMAWHLGSSPAPASIW
jgi:hypothetical protein